MSDYISLYIVCTTSIHWKCIYLQKNIEKNVSLKKRPLSQNNKKKYLLWIRMSLKHMRIFNLVISADCNFSPKQYICVEKISILHAWKGKIKFCQYIKLKREVFQYLNPLCAFFCLYRNCFCSNWVKYPSKRWDKTPLKLMHVWKAHFFSSSF